ncbi:MAG TPA: phasin family protein [Noviherbaspirillum sp.]|uniref:phasin family protein n=1 Tax=Noviherbaspirillum sp. TaxID=1926288 RepID=UPI002B4670AF|nr:phasin family protein [Noviherbaspirillum sp.]HJV84434.1 phasin family protein [Noviherbaspirillum sp.]
MTAKANSHAHSDDKDLVEAARKSVDQIWQAGLGAFARAQKEGEDMFSRLVQEGMAVQKRARKVAEGRLEGMSDTIAKMADSLGKQASGSLDKLENVFEERVARSLHSIGVPTRDDIKELSAQIKELQDSVNAVLAKKPATRATTKSATASATATKKRAVAKPAKPATSRATARTGSKRTSGTTSARM